MGRAARVPDPSPSGGAATLARNSNFERLVRRLLAAGADPAVLCHGLSPREVAMRKVDPAIFGLLERHAAMKAVGL